MNRSWIRTMIALLFPSGLVVLACAGLVAARLLPNGLPQALPFYPALVWAGAAVLGWRFHRARVVLAVLSLALADLSLRAFAGGDEVLSGGGMIVFDAVAFLLPLDLAALAIAKEGGLFSRWGGIAVGLVLVQIPAVFVIGLVPGSRLAALVSHRFPEGHTLGALALPTPAIAAWVIASLALAALFAVKRGPVEGGFLWALAASVLALAPGAPGPESTLYLAAASLALGASAIEAGHAMAFRDDLTGLLGRRALNEALAGLSGPFAVAMVDVDHFKKFNDAHGHDVGDQVLKMVAARLGEVAGGGTAYRYGGEEFSFLFPGKTAAEVEPHLETLREAVAHAALTLRGTDRPAKKPAKAAATSAVGSRATTTAKPRARALPGPKPTAQARSVSVTISIGLAQGKSGSNPIAVLKAADKALYRAKEGGRNRVSR